MRWYKRTVIIGALMLAVVAATVMYGATLFTVIVLASTVVAATNHADWWQREASRLARSPVKSPAGVRRQ